MMTVQGLTKTFGSRTLFHDLSFDARNGQLVALTGPSGAGKSTLLNCLGLLDEPTAGTISVDGVPITALSLGGAQRFRRDKLGYLFQNYALMESSSVETNLAVASRGRRSRARFRDALARVGLAGREKASVHQLSGGEQQRVALARLIVKQPTVILADEPTGSLDTDNAAMVVDTLRAFADDGCVVVIATHATEVVKACDHRVRLGRTSTDPGDSMA